MRRRPASIRCRSSASWPTRPEQARSNSRPRPGCAEHPQARPALDADRLRSLHDPAPASGRRHAALACPPLMAAPDTAGGSGVTRASRVRWSPYLQAGVHTLLEKPVAPDMDQGREIVRLAEASGAILQIGHLERSTGRASSRRSAWAGSRSARQTWTWSRT